MRRKMISYPCWMIFVCAVTTLFFAPLEARSIFSEWTVSEFQPDVPNGGRANTIAVNPRNADAIFVASETGGLFSSTDRGIRWRHVDSLPSFRVVSVAYIPTDPSILLVTTGDNFETSSAGGIWRSTDNGGTWNRVSVTFPPGVGNSRFNAFDISIASDAENIFVGSDNGVLKSIDNGLSWVYQDAFGNSSAVYSVAALGNDRALVAGPYGVRWTDNGGMSWAVPATSPGGISDFHALGRSPVSNMQAFVVNDATSLFHTEDGGQNWTQILSAPAGGGGCGGISFAKAANRSGRPGIRPRVAFDLFFGNKCGVSRMRVIKDNTTGSFDYTGTWQNLGLDHSDTRDLAFDNLRRPLPLLLATDGGLHKTVNGGNNWTFTGGGRNGYNALQITEVQGQYIDDVGRFNLYFGTQDNDVWSSGNYGASWTKGMCCEGFFIEAAKKVSTAANSVVTNVACGVCVNLVSGPLFAAVNAWSNPPGDVAGNPVIIRNQQFIQGVNATSGFPAGIAVTNNLGASWQQYAAFADAVRSIPKLGRAGSGIRQSTVVYQVYRAAGYSSGGFEINWLMRISKRPSNATASVTYPAMNNFGGLGINPTMFAWYQVFAVDPGNHLHIIAPDVVNQKMMETRDGGENWTEIAGLTNLVTDGGRLRFSSSIFPVVTAISFSPQNPDVVAIGTSEGGIYVSTDNGKNWFRVKNSEGVTYATGFAWNNANDVIISTYGRGLWRLENILIFTIPDLEARCKFPCLIRGWPWEDLVDPEGPVIFERGILVYDGTILGARMKDRVVNEIYVSHGSSVMFTGNEEKSLGVKVTYAKAPMGFRGSNVTLKPSTDAQLMKGLVFDKDNRLKGAVFGDKQMPMFEEVDTVEQDGNKKSPNDGKPYIKLQTPRFSGAPTAAANEMIPITIANLKSNRDVIIYVDDVPSTKGRTDIDGSFKAEVKAPEQEGLHGITIRFADDEKNVIDGTMFLVKHLDEIEKEQKPK
jgi:photosystem II stability/assembly factor-like uncharacterized protein